MSEGFLGGVVEGFYGRTWSQSQRLDLLGRMADWGLNTYFYSPKDDLKHRAAWRERYDDAELAAKKELVDACQSHDLYFFYGLSPGLDIQFSEDQEHAAVRARLSQMMEIGVRHFALLFDDLPGKMSESDQARFGSVAAAQAYVANQTFDWLREQDPKARLLFCPTPYCDRMVGWKLGGEDYLDVLGESLDPEIDILWTGQEIISEDLTAESLAPIVARIKRKPIIWDNQHANDYDLRRHFCGPYTRSSEMKNHVRGVLSNPNNEYALNYIPLRTLGRYLNDADYNPRTAFLQAVKEWTPHFQTLDGCVDEQDVMLIADCYYLPHRLGESAEALQHVCKKLLLEPTDAWSGEYEQFLDFHRRILGVFDQLTQLRDRELFYGWSRRIWELREELDLIKDFVEAKRSGGISVAGMASETHLPQTCRGGLVAELQRYLVMKEGRWHSA